MAAGLGIALGYFLGGVLTSERSWRWVMLVNVPFGAAVLVLAPRFISEPERHPGRVDWAGAIMSTLGMGALAYAFIRVGEAGWGDRQAIGAFAAAAVLTAGFVAWQARAAYPVMPLRLFADRNRAAGRLLSQGVADDLDQALAELGSFPRQHFSLLERSPLIHRSRSRQDASYRVTAQPAATMGGTHASCIFMQCVAYSLREKEAPAWA
jgi:MFS family permease